MLFLGIDKVGPGRGEVFRSFTGREKMLIGPFDSEGAREIFCQYWERQLNSDDNPNQFQFFFKQTLPEGWGAVHPHIFKWDSLRWDSLRVDDPDAPEFSRANKE